MHNFSICAYGYFKLEALENAQIDGYYISG